ncbi:MAG: hypothetical protein WBA99_01750 [Nodosilinea sp.]
MTLQLMALPTQLVTVVQVLLVPICFVLAWGLVGVTAWSLITSVRDGVSRAATMHKIPCANCLYFTGDHRLKCPIHPKVALSESAIDCGDFEQAGFM